MADAVGTIEIGDCLFSVAVQTEKNQINIFRKKKAGGRVYMPIF